MLTVQGVVGNAPSGTRQSIPSVSRAFSTAPAGFHRPLELGGNVAGVADVMLMSSPSRRWLARRACAASTRDVQLAGGWKNPGMVARYAARVGAGAVGRFMREPAGGKPDS